MPRTRKARRRKETTDATPQWGTSVVELLRRRPPAPLLVAVGYRPGADGIEPILNVSDLRLGHLVQEVIGRPGACAEGNRASNEASTDDEHDKFHGVLFLDCVGRTGRGRLEHSIRQLEQCGSAN